MRRIAWTAAAVLVTTAGPGCQTVAPQAISVLSRPEAPSTGGIDYTYGGGRAVQIFRQNPAAVHAALLSSMDDIRIESVKQISDGGSIIFEGLTADRRKATVTLRPEGTGTRLAVRIGYLGDQPLSRALMDRVGIRLGNLPPAAIPQDLPSEPGKAPLLNRFDRKAVSDVEMLSDQADALDHQSPVYEVKPYVQTYPNP